MKINVTNILLGLLIVILAWQNFSGKDPVEPVPITITIPEIKGSSSQSLEQVKVVPIYLPNTNQQINVDYEWKKKYELAKDSMEKQQIYLESIKIKEYEETLVDNDSIKITGYARTRGSLLDYTVDYRIKPHSFSYTPDVVVRRPALSMGFGVEFGVPTSHNTGFIGKGNMYFENQKGNGFSLGYDTDRHIWVGVRKTFKIKK